MKIRVRIPPSPTGEPHIGTAYVALFNYAFAKKEDGVFILRIEDTDRSRLVADSEKKIIESLKWLGLVWDEGPYRQSERLPLYKKAAEELIESKNAYYCNCTPERLSKLREELQKKKEMPRYDKKCFYSPPKKGPFVVRLRVPEKGDTSFEDIIRGKIVFKNKDIDDAVILKSDGWPTYHLASVVDDADMKISHVIRAEEWLSSTPKHVLIYEGLGKKLPLFAHLPLLRNPDRSKISKRKNPISLLWYKNQGFLPQAMLNYLALMGWSHPEGKEIFDLNDFIEHFDLKRIDPTGPVFDIVKLEWMNGEYIRKMSNDELTKRLTDFTAVQSKNIANVLPLIKERIKKLSEFDELTGYFFKDVIEIEKEIIVQKGKSVNETKKVLMEISEVLNEIDWNKTAIETSIKEYQANIGWSNTDLFQTIRAATTGKRSAPPLFDTLEILGKKKTVSRIKKAVSLLS